MELIPALGPLHLSRPSVSTSNYFSTHPHRPSPQFCFLLRSPGLAKEFLKCLTYFAFVSLYFHPINQHKSQSNLLFPFKKIITEVLGMMYKSLYLTITSVSNTLLLNTYSVCRSFCSFLNKLSYFSNMYFCSKFPL